MTEEEYDELRYEAYQEYLKERAQVDEEWQLANGYEQGVLELDD